MGTILIIIQSFEYIIQYTYNTVAATTDLEDVTHQIATFGHLESCPYFD